MIRFISLRVSCDIVSWLVLLSGGANGRAGRASLPGLTCVRSGAWPARVAAAARGIPPTCREVRWTAASFAPRARLVSCEVKLEAERGGGMLVFFSPERAFAKRMGDEPGGFVPEFRRGFHTTAWFCLAGATDAPGGAPAGGGDPPGAATPAPGTRDEGVAGIAGPGANGEELGGGAGEAWGGAGVPSGGPGGWFGCGVPPRPPLPGSA